MSSRPFIPEQHPPERFVVEVFSELDRQVVEQRWHDVNVVLRLSMLSGLEMQLDATLNMLCDLAGEIVQYDGALVFFDGEDDEPPQVRVARDLEGLPQDAFVRGNILNFWATKYSRPLLITRGHNLQA